ncbi:hypothetical protein QQS21_004796 [Conoideocrella luteorostrata]|uniref:Small ribosomal subunit protein mS38 n=1 Tax=Conoideocrella luteorostrata TaxID=1105319 RepID=A0AAJ0CQT3_9HYPO|nr:hypothetical protein QQS21_004796 [Conoideocrella luteorostrata]
MLPSSARRVAFSGPQTVLASSLTAAARASTATVPVFIRSHQRRYSSSKPSRSDNGSNEISTSQSVTASTSRSESKTGTEKRKRKSKDASEKGASFKRLPSVPSTHHMSQEALGLSSFFSLHRPISITQTMPRTVSDEHFASIFAPRTKVNKVTDTMSTISSTIDNLEAPMAQLTIGGHDDQGMGEGMQRVEIRNPDGTESSLYLQVDTMSGEFLPFRPPPLPQAESAAEADGLSAEADAVEPAPHHRVYKAMFTIEESTEPDGQIRIVAHSPRIVNDEQPRSFLERMAKRQLQADAARGRRDMYAISVKRQRKLKMKKKKYKKLMKRTRNLRRKLDRT